MSQRARTALIVIAAAVLLSAALLFAATRQDSTSRTPTGTVRAALRAYETGDLPALREHFCDPDLAALIFPDTDNQRYRFTGMTYAEVEISASAAQVIASGTLHDASGSGGQTHALSWTVNLTRDDGTWCITAVTRAHE